MDMEAEKTPKEAWDTLTDPEREICITLSVSDWQSGVGQDYIDAMEMDKMKVDELNKRGVIDVRPGWQFAQEFIDQNKDKAERLETKRKDVFADLTDEERSFLNLLDNKKRVAEYRNEAPRYRLANENFHNYLNEQLSAQGE